LVSNLLAMTCLIMPLKTPSSPAKPGGKLKGKVLTPSSGKDKNKPSSKKKAPAQPPVVSITWWEALSPERKLDVVGVVMSVVGLLTLLILFSAQRSALTGNVVHVLGQIFGWGITSCPSGSLLWACGLSFAELKNFLHSRWNAGQASFCFFSGCWP